jgi:peptide/nickel transport system ATP-binding protein
MTVESLLRIEDVSVVHAGSRRGRSVQAVSNVSLDVPQGDTLGLVGESGCGKSSLAHAVVQLPPPTSGRVWLGDVDLTVLQGKALRAVRPSIQMILQDPISSLNPRRTVAEIVGEPAAAWNRARGPALDRLVDESLEAVGMDPRTTRNRRPHEFSGGQCQRICIARALILGPRVIICDEPVSALDVSIQAQILNLLEDLRTSRRLTMLFISHDLAVVKNVSDRIAVMYLGKLCELAPAEDLYRRPVHPYTAALLEAIPSVQIGRPRTRRSQSGVAPSSADPPSGCRFRTRCPRAQEVCAAEEPQFREVSPGHFVACHFPLSALDVQVPPPIHQTVTSLNSL